MSQRDRQAPIDGPADPDGRPAYDANGVDLTLVRAELARTPAERLEALRQEVESLERIRRVGRVPTR